MNETTITDGLGSVRTEAAPRRTITAYKLMRLVDGKLYPLYIDRSEPVELGVWYNADSVSKTALESLDFGYHLIDLRSEQVIESRQRKPSLDQVKRATAHNWRWFYVVQQKTKIGYKNVGIAESNGREEVKAEYALRPGWHCGSLPVMNQIGKGANHNLRDDSFVWTEIEISADVDYNAEAKANGGELYYIPTDGYYLKCTNANKKAAQADKMDWYIAGAIKINRIISDSEARQIIDRYNREHRTNIKYDYPRESGKMFNADTMQLEGCLNGTNDFYALFSDDNDLLVDFGVGWNRRDVRRKAVEYMKEHNIQSAFIEITDCEGEIKDTIDIDLGLQGTKKTATALTVTVFKFKAVKTPPQAFKRRSTTTISRLASYTVSGTMMGTNINNTINRAKLLEVIRTFNSDKAEDFITEIGKCFPNQVEKERRIDEHNKRVGHEEMPKPDSKYQQVDFPEYGVKILLRVSNHNINATNIQEDVEEAYSLAIKNDKENKFKPNDKVTVTEYVFLTENCDRNKYRRIAQNILNFLDTSEWNEDFVKHDFKNPDDKKPLSGTDAPKYANKETVYYSGHAFDDSHPKYKSQSGYYPVKILFYKNGKYMVFWTKFGAKKQFYATEDELCREKPTAEPQPETAEFKIGDKFIGNDGTIYTITNIRSYDELDDYLKAVLERNKSKYLFDLNNGQQTLAIWAAKIKEMFKPIGNDNITTEPTPGELTEAEKEKLRSYQGNGGQGKKTTERGILDEYYTPDYVCEFMYQLAVRYGYTAGKVLEPSCATGNCIRPIYERNDYTHIDAFEINQTSREICKKLYPNVTIYENYFETAFLEQPRFSTKAKKTWLENAPYDLIIGNPPYGKHVNRYSSYFGGKDHFEQIEMFFMAKALELLRSGGLLIYITSTNFMSTGNKYQQAKERIAAVADFVDAYRLPKVFANTDICTDIIVLRKK